MQRIGKLISAVFCGIAAAGLAMLFANYALDFFLWLLGGFNGFKPHYDQYYSPLAGTVLCVIWALIFVLPVAFGAWCGEYFYRANLTPALKTLQVVLLLGLATWIAWFGLHLMAIHSA
jgi:hypothetical protein